MSEKKSSSKKSTTKSAIGTKKPAVKKAPAKKAPAEKPAAKKPAAKKAPAKKPAAKKAPAKKPAAKKTPAKKTPAKKPAAKKPAAKKPAAEKPAAKKPAAKKTPAKKAPAKKPAAKKPATKKPAAKKTPAKKTPAKKPATKKPTIAVAGKPGRAEPKPPILPPRPKKPTSFKVGDKVVHPHHGAAIISKKVKQVVLGERRDYFVLQIATDQLTVFVPVDTIDETIRPVISKTAAGRVLRLFKDEPQEAGSNWSRWYKVLNEKMTSGDINQVAEVVRDLTFAQQTKGISPALKRMLARARLTLTSELAFAFNVNDEDATKRLDRALLKPPEEEV